ncbi:MAG: KpsF/GutQ family sugar-phosphate isomerase [Prevotellaceae bacterium]|jgi:arabinose-5-phosphate isomerase|nr:KpsF/GutQ family sugar-phosphate isomerase [Prevotellaceae bacterium]
MIDDNQIKQLAVSTILTEADAVRKLSEFVDNDFVNAVKFIHSIKGRVIVTGIGKSANIATKIVASLNSTGTPSIFMHAADAIHGDLGIIQPDDVVICLSKSGNTAEIKLLIPLIQKMKNKIIALVSNVNSYLAQQADFILRATVTEEACPNNLAPTSSTTAQLVVGDALAICLLKMRGFSADDFARVHPGGSLGKKLYTRVGDIMSKAKPQVKNTDIIRDVIIEISSNFLGSTAVVDDFGKIIGIITDGDLRRMLQREVDTKTLCAKDIMSLNPKTIESSELAIKAFTNMEKNKITQLLVTHDEKYVGVIHIHDIIREGIV